MVESFFVQVGWALRSTWAQINGWMLGDKSAGMGNTVNSKATIHGLSVGLILLAVGKVSQKISRVSY
ncbi:hypothetical protein ACJ6YJ_15725 [Pseudomonas marginalis]|uniref:Uncharacterized protein n=1 Tax=Pseudomonas marginalis TaxID=298 RepID=A0A9X9BTA6_PSEMA|nr:MULTISPECIES: hypothetical protein [Pseudomonas]MDT9635207.1 hypothetical protein [Pseudomonas sp. JV449]TWR59596.1 hypothetical protein FIV41_12620 [Pseudomonas marginalis]